MLGTTKFLPVTKSWRNALFILFGLFLLSRILTLASFPIFNDEAIYLQYAQRINDDWQKNKFISMHGEFTDWKPPLMYWLAAPVIAWGNDPLLAGRAVAFLASVAGFVGFYLLAKELFGEREGVICALLYVLCPPVLFHNNQFTAETFLVSTAAFFYWAVLKAMQRDKSGWWVWAAVAILSGVALLLFKQSGLLLMAVSILLPFAKLRTKEAGVPDRSDWKTTAVNLALIVAVISCCRFAVDAMLPSAFDATRDHFNRRWVMRVREVFDLPMEIWGANLRIVARYIYSYYSWPLALLFSGFGWVAFRKKNCPERALAGMCLAGAMAVTFLLRGFNEYVFNTAVIVTLLPLLARWGLSLFMSIRSVRIDVVHYAALTLGVFTLAHWLHQDILMTVAPGRYIERSTPWAVSNYLTSWSTGFGVKEIAVMLEKEKQPGVVFVDAQWGNPGTALAVYGKERFPQLRIVPVSREFLDQAETQKLKEAALKIAPVHFAIYSSDTSGERPKWQNNLQEQMCETRSEIEAYPSQAPIVLCTF